MNLNINMSILACKSALYMYICIYMYELNLLKYVHAIRTF